jgi:hypothetical protein
MKKIILIAIVFALALPLSAATWKNVTLMDAGCATKKHTDAAAEGHTKACMTKCGSKAGYGVIADGKFVKFDKNGDKLASAALKKSEKDENIHVDVTGAMKNGKLAVSAISIN